jgi:hypothetical protein
MEFIQRIFLYVSVTAFLGLIVGLFRPWIMLWWEDTQTRKKIFQLYGTVAAVTFIIYRILLLI